MPKPTAKTVYYFCDESSYVDDEFMAVAGLAVPDYALAPITADLLKIKADLGGPTETKWATAKHRRNSTHEAFLDYFDEAVRAKLIHFHIRFAPFTLYDHAVSGPKRRIDTTSKMHFQLLLHRAVRFYGKHYKLRIRPDNGDCTAALVDQIGSLHTWGHENYGCARDCVESIEPRDSRSEVMLQLLDVPLGALTALRNKRVLTGPKLKLAGYVAEKFKDKNLERNTPIATKDFSIWNVIPSGPGGTKNRGPWG